MLIRITFLLSIFIFPTFVNSSINPEVDKKWKSEINILRIGLLGGENEADRIKNYECWRLYLEDNLKIPVKFFPASDYAGVIHGLLGGFLIMQVLVHQVMQLLSLKTLILLNQY